MSLSTKSSHGKKHRSDKDKSSKHSSKDKGKSKAAVPSASVTTSANDSPFLRTTSKIRLSIPPAFASDLRRGVEEMLDSMVMRYVPALEAVLLAYSDVQFEDTTAGIVNDCPFAVCDIWFEAVVWAPKVGMKLHGIHSLSSPSHISLILYKTFNVSIPLENIPRDRFTFEEAEEIDEAGFETEGVAHLSGRWKDSSSGKILGSDKEEVGFFVTGLQTSNQMLSLTGSLLGVDASGVPLGRSFVQRSNAVASGTQLGNELASQPSSSINPTRLPSAGENLVVAAKNKRSKQKESSRVPTMGVDVANSSHVNQAMHEAQPDVQGTAMPDIEDEDLRSHRKEQKRAEKEAKRQARREKESQRQTEAQAEQRAQAMVSQVKEEGADGVASPRKKEKKHKRSAEEAALGEKSSKRKKV